MSVNKRNNLISSYIMTDTINITATLQDYQSAIDQVRSTLNGLDTTSNEYKNTLDKLNSAQQNMANALGQSQNSMDELAANIKTNSSNMLADVQNLGQALGIGFPGFLATATTAWKTFSATMMANPWVAVLTVALGAIIGFINMFKNRLKESEETGDKWKKSMATFEPILRAVRKAIGFVIDTIVDGISWMTDKIPGFVRFIGQSIDFVLDKLAYVGEAIAFIPGLIAKAINASLPIIAKGVNAIASGIAWVLDKIGLDDIANSLKAGIGNFMNSTIAMGNAAVAAFAGVGNKIRGAGKAAQTFMNNIATAMTYSRQLADNEDKLEDSIRNNNILQAEGLKEQAKLLQDINKLSKDDPKRLELQNKLEESIKRTGSAQLAIERQTLDLMERRAALDVNSEEENNKLFQQRAKVAETEAKTYRELAALARRRLQTEQALNNAKEQGDKAAEKSAQKQLAQINKLAKEQEKLRQKEIEDAIKRDKNATKEQRDRSAALVKELEEQIKFNNELLKQTEEREKSELEIKRAYNKSTLADELKYENERWDRLSDSYDKQIEEYRKLLDNTELLEADRMRIHNAINIAILENDTETNKHRIAIAKIYKDEITKISKELQETYKMSTNIDNINLSEGYVKGLKDLNDKYEQGIISYNAYVKRLQEINKEHQAEQNRIQLEGLKRQSENNKKVYEEYIRQIAVFDNGLIKGSEQTAAEIDNHIKELLNEQKNGDDARVKELEENLRKQLEQYGISLPDLLGMYIDYQTSLTEAQKKEEENRKQGIQNELRSNKDLMNQLSKVGSQMANTMAAVGDYWQDSIEQRLEAGEISQEEADAEFERLKQFNIAQAVVSTLAGALQAQMSVWKEPSLGLWAKIAMSVLLGAQTLASGFAQINQIRSQTLSGAAGGNSNPNYIISAATPVLSEAQDVNQLTANAATTSAGTSDAQSDLRVYVVESDITNAQNRQRVRVSETTF